MRRVARLAAFALAFADMGATPLRAATTAGGGTAAIPTPAMTLAHAYGTFGFDTLRELRARKPGTNVFISPASLGIAFAMVANGANGATKAAILKTLGASDQSLPSLNAANEALIAALEDEQNIQLSVANALWLQDGLQIEPDFLSTLRSQFGAQATNLDFRSADAAPAINDWAAKHTNGRITKIVNDINPATVLMLTNAVAFKATWTFPFDPAVTQPHDFTTAASGVRKVPMMTHTGHYSYANKDGVETIRLPYADGDFAMYVALPKNASTMDAFLRDLTPATFDVLLSSLGNGSGAIDLPRFTIAYDATLNPVLEKLGMGIAFENDADFSGIHRGPPAIRISTVRHASFLKVDEEGTEAAAVTVIGMETMAMRAGPPPFHMIVDRPFFVAIRDERSGQILFTGTIADPE